MTLTRIILLLLGIGLTIMIVFAAIEAPIGQSFARITQDLWGWVTLADLYLGFLLISIIIAVVERNAAIAIIWIVPLYFLGNIWSALWFALRLPKIIDRLR